MSLLGRFEPSTSLEDLQRILPNRLKHPQTWLFPLLFGLLQQALLDERGHALESLPRMITRCFTDGLDCFEGAAVDKDRQSSKEALLFFIEQMVAPGNRIAQALLARWYIASPARQEGEPLGESGQQGLRREQGDAGGRQFNGQWQPLQADTHRGYGTSVGAVDLERRLEGLGTLEEKHDGS